MSSDILLCPAKAGGQNEISFGRKTGVFAWTSLKYHCARRGQRSSDGNARTGGGVPHNVKLLCCCYYVDVVVVLTAEPTTTTPVETTTTGRSRDIMFNTGFIVVSILMLSLLLLSHHCNVSTS